MLLGFSFILGLGLLFTSPIFNQHFLLNNPEYIPEYIQYSRIIFQFGNIPFRNSHIGESILMPILGQITGANKTVIGFKLLTISFYIIYLPVMALLAQQLTRNYIKTYIFIGLYVLTYEWLWSYNVIFPDSLTILLLGIAGLTQSVPLMFVCIALSCLSHFSITVIAVAALLLATQFAPPIFNNAATKKVAYAIAALIVGRLILQFWFWLYNFSSGFSRLSWVFDQGLYYFIERYHQAPLEFWLVPGKFFLMLYLFAIFFFVVKKSFKYVVALLLIIALDYFSLFFTIDGLRIHFTIMSAVYPYILLVLIIQSYDGFILFKHAKNTR